MADLVWLLTQPGAEPEETECIASEIAEKSGSPGMTLVRAAVSRAPVCGGWSWSVPLQPGSRDAACSEPTREQKRQLILEFGGDRRMCMAGSRGPLTHC